MTYFQTKTRDNGETFICQKDDAPEWVGEAVHAAHNLFDLFPHNWVYDVCAEFFDELDADSDEDLVFSIADSGVDVYTHDLVEWLKTFHYMLDELRDEFGDSSSNFSAEIMRAQFVARERIGMVILAAIQEESE